MKKLIAILIGAASLAAIGVPAAAFAQPAIGVSIGIGQPGVYGRIRIGDGPPPALVSARPALIAPPRLVVREQAPAYLYVPPAHQRDWRRYCGRYDACGQPVYFVRDQWVRDRYAHRHPGWDQRPQRGHDRDRGFDERGFDHRGSDHRGSDNRRVDDHAHGRH